MSIKLHNELIAVAKRIREIFDNHNVGYMSLDIKITGRVHDELKISYEICEQYDSGVKGGNLNYVVDEYFRRRGWNSKYAPLAIAFGDSNGDDESNDLFSNSNSDKE